MSYFFDTQVMLILILIDVQYSQNAVFSFEKGSNCQNHSSSGSHHPVKNSPSKIFDSQSGEGEASNFTRGDLLPGGENLGRSDFDNLNLFESFRLFEPNSLPPPSTPYRYLKNPANSRWKYSRRVFMKRFYVFLPKQEHFWSFYTFLKIRKQKKTLQTDPYKILWGIFYLLT